MTLKELNCYMDCIKEIKRLNTKARVELRKLNRFIYSCDDPLVRSILLNRFLEGYSWTAVANKIGGGISADNCRILVARYLEVNKKK